MMDWPKIHESRAISLQGAPLAVLSSLYGLGVRVRSRLYAKRRKRKLPGFVLSIGNLTVGGTGKTPAVCMIAKWALKEGWCPAVLSRGYGAKHQGKILEVSDGRRLLCAAVEAGDEPYLLAKNLEGIPVIVSKARDEAGVLAHQRHGSNFFILDDGFQHLRLHRDFDVVLLDATSPFGNMHLLPRGPLREPVDQLKRADALIFTRTGRGIDPVGMGDVKDRFQDKPIFESDHVPESLILPNLGISHAPDSIQGKRVVAFAGIAKPETFRELLLGLNAEIVLFRGFRDHHGFVRSEIRELVDELRRLHADLLITTEKDFFRLGPLAPTEQSFGYLTIQFRMTSGAETLFEMIKEKARSACFTK